MRLPLILALLASCFGARPNLRSYYVIGPEPLERFHTPLFTGLVRVRNMDTDSIYDKFQIVLRRNPYELNYSEQHVWAVKPKEMVSDVIASALAETNTFGAVQRELGEVRPEYLLSGDLHALEIYDSDDLWFAHVAVTLRLSRFSTGETLFSHTYEARKLVERENFSHAVRGMSELVGAALIESLDVMRQRYGLPRKEDPRDGATPRDQPIYIPEGAPDPSELPPPVEE